MGLRIVKIEVVDTNPFAWAMVNIGYGAMFVYTDNNGDVGEEVIPFIISVDIIGVVKKDEVAWRQGKSVGIDKSVFCQAVVEGTHSPSPLSVDFQKINT